MALSDILMTQVQGELLILGLRDEFGDCIEAVKYIVFGLILAKLTQIKKKRRAAQADDNIAT